MLLKSKQSKVKLWKLLSLKPKLSWKIICCENKMLFAYNKCQHKTVCTINFVISNFVRVSSSRSALQVYVSK